MTIFFRLASLLLLLGPSLVLAQNDPVACTEPGVYQDQGTAVCHYCAPGTYNNQPTPAPGACTSAQSGHKACGLKQVNGVGCFGATKMDDCGAGNYQPNSGQATCIICPPGSTCTSNTQDKPQLCSKGTAQPAAGSSSSSCPDCPKGTYSFVNGATRCCNCCAGTYNDQTHQDHCFYCGEHTNPQVYNSPVGATSVSQCQSAPVDGVTRAPKGTCDVTPQEPPAGTKAFCHEFVFAAAEQGDTPNPNPSSINKRRRSLSCARGYTRCRHYHGRGGFECVDTGSDPEKCGGCVDVDFDGHEEESQGVDCTAIPNVNVVDCKRSKCIIQSCRKGYTKSSDGKQCIADAFHAQGAYAARRQTVHRRSL